MNLEEPSAELDLAVAKAAGLKAFITEYGCCFLYVKSTEPTKPFRPSREWKDAMEAAEKAFPGGWTLSSRPDIGRTQYAFYSHANPGTITGELTGPLAICALILESKEMQ